MVFIRFRRGRGIGYETARILAIKKATVVIAVRNMEKGNAAANKRRRCQVNYFFSFLHF